MLNIPKIQGNDQEIAKEMAILRAKLSPDGNLVSDKGRELTIKVFGEPLSPLEIVTKICADVKSRGIEAVIDYCTKIDGAELTAETIRVPAEELAAAHRDASEEFLATVRRVRENILAFQTAILHKDVRVERPGGYLVQRYLPMRRVGLCVPGGAAAYPSSVLMNAVPAQAAGVEELVVVAPPTKFGAYNPDMLAVCHELGITEVYRLGGAQAVAAMAYGAGPIEQVDKIVGPGNLFVALAKKLVYGEVDIDSIAGPSEVVVIVDETTNPQFTAYDLMAQAEHSPGASILVGWDKALLDATVAAIEKEITQVEREDLTRWSLEEFGAVILARDPDHACELTNQIAPEHLHVATANPERFLDKLHNAGAIFLGEYTPVALGDYAAGPSHVLPTSGTARFAGGLCSNDFLRSGSVLHFDRTGLENLAADVETLADKEGLTAHRDSVKRRL